HRARRMLAAKQPLTESLKGNRAARDARYGWRQRGRSGPGCDRPGGWCLRAFGETRSLLRAVERGRPPVGDECWRRRFAGAAVAGALAAVAVLALPAVASAAPAGPRLLSQTTWGGPGTDAGSGIAVSGDGSAYVTGLSDSFTTDAFGQPRAAIFAVKFGADGS